MSAPPLLLTIPQVASHIGVTRRTVYNLIAAGEFPTVDIAVPGARNTRTRVRSSDLEQWIADRTTDRSKAAS